MKQVKYNPNIYEKFFSEYTHSQSIIFSHLKGDYPYELYVDDEHKPAFGILYTTLDYHFVFGEIDIDQLQQNLMLYIKNHHSQEAIILTPDGNPSETMKEFISRFNGVIGKRFFFKLNKEIFKNIVSQFNSTNIIITKETFKNSKKSYLKASWIENEKELGFSKVFALGNNYGEIDVFTDELHRKKGIAVATSIALIQECLKEGIEPLWTAWSAKIESHKVAERIGFKKVLDIHAFIWIQDFFRIE